MSKSPHAQRIAGLEQAVDKKAVKKLRLKMLAIIALVLIGFGLVLGAILLAFAEVFA
jgi:uncharacterized membrane protein YqjE